MTNLPSRFKTKKYYLATSSTLKMGPGKAYTKGGKATVSFRKPLIVIVIS